MAFLRSNLFGDSVRMFRQMSRDVSKHCPLSSRNILKYPPTGKAGHSQRSEFWYFPISDTNRWRRVSLKGLEWYPRYLATNDWLRYSVLLILTNFGFKTEYGFISVATRDGKNWQEIKFVESNYSYPKVSQIACILAVENFFCDF